MTTQTTDPREYLKAADVARIIGVADLILLAAREPVMWRDVRAELARAARLKEKYRYALASLGDRLHELIERAEMPIDRNLPRSAAARRLLLPDGDVYFRIASLLPHEHPYFSDAEPDVVPTDVVPTDNDRLLQRILEPIVLQALEQRLTLVQTRLSAAQLKSCVDGCTQGVLTFDAAGRCIFSNPAATSMLGGPPETHLPAELRRALQPLPHASTAVHWRDRVTFHAAGRPLRAFPFFAPDEGGGALLHVFLIAEPDIEAAVREVQRRGALSEREAAVLLRVVEGLSYPAIARELGVKTNTVNTFVDRCSEKLKVSGREEMIKLVYSMLPMLTPA